MQVQVYKEAALVCTRQSEDQKMDFIPKPKKRPGNFSTDPDEDDATPVVNDPVVAAAMQEDQARKQAKKGGAPPPGCLCHLPGPLA